jgi:hypothetical protein
VIRRAAHAGFANESGSRNSGIVQRKVGVHLIASRASAIVKGEAANCRIRADLLDSFLNDLFHCTLTASLTATSTVSSTSFGSR